MPRPCFAALKGEAKVRVVPRGSTNARFLPEYRNFLRCVRCLCQLPLPACPFPGGVSGGGAALSSLCGRPFLRRHNDLISRRSPLSGLSFSLFFFLRERKRGYWRRRSRKISVGEAKCYIYRHKRAAALHLIRPSGTFPSEGKAERTAFAPNTETFSAVHNISVVCLTRLARSPGVLRGRSRIEFIVSPLPRRRHNESHFAAKPPERSFFFPLFLSPRKKKRL